MELIVLGGSAAAPNGDDASSGYLVTSGDTAILIECGSGVVSKLRARCDARALAGVVISHLHSDHTLDLVALRYALKYAPPGPAAPIPLHLPPGGCDFAERLGAVFAVGTEAGTDFWGDILVPREYDPLLDRDAPLTIGPLTLRFAPMRHYIPVWAIRVDDALSGRSLTYSADTGPQAPLAAFAAHSDLLLCEATLLQQAPDSDPAGWGHLTAAEAARIAADAGVGRLVLTHLWAELGIDRYLAAARAIFPGRVDAARSGMTFTV